MFGKSIPSKPVHLSLIIFASLISSAQAQLAAQGTLVRPELGLHSVCGYTIKGKLHDVPAGVNLCWRAPFPYLSEYGLLYCDPKFLFQELALVKRGDRRCHLYEYRQ